jgi:hypothetical protein
MEFYGTATSIMIVQQMQINDTKQIETKELTKYHPYKVVQLWAVLLALHFCTY